MEWVDARKLTRIPLYLEGLAAIWCTHITENGTKAFTAYVIAREVLRTEILPTDVKRQLRLKLRQRELQRGEEVSKNFNGVISLCYQYEHKILDEDLVSKLREGLHPDMCNQVLMSKATTAGEFHGHLTIAAEAIKRKRLQLTRHILNIKRKETE